MGDVFISYKAEDRPRVQPLVGALQADGLRVWWDQHIGAGEEWSGTIERELDGARSVVVIWSKRSVGTDGRFVREEARRAQRRSTYVPVLIDAVEAPLGFAENQAISLRSWRGDRSDERYQALLRAIRRHVDPTTSLAPVRASQRTYRVKWAIFSGSRAWAFAATTVMAILLAGVGLLWNSSRSAARGGRIAVQPFRPVGASAMLGDFATSLSNSLQDALTQDQFQTLSPTEAETLKGDDIEARAKKLGVGMMFSGTVQAKGPDINVSMRLDDPVQQASLWTAEIRGPASQSDRLEAQVGALTVAVLNCSAQALAPGVRMSDAALQAFLHACELSQTDNHGMTDARSAYAMLDAMRWAVRVAPDFAAGHSMLAKHLAFTYAVTFRDQPALRTEAAHEVRTALRLDPKDPDAFVTLGLLAPPLDFEQRERMFRQALATDPAWPHANGFLGNVMADVGRLHDSVALYQRAAAGNPESVDWTEQVAGGLISIGETAEADRELARFAQLWPNDILTWDYQLESMIAQKRWADALHVLDRAGDFGSSVAPDWVADWRELLETLQSGHAAARTSLRRKLLASSATDPRQAIIRLTMLGFVDDAFAVAQHYRPAASDSPGFLFQPEAAPLRRDPRFMSLAARFGLVSYWRRTGHWPDFCDHSGLSYSCQQEAAKLSAPSGV